MTSRSYPEWFVGGPWHGKDKLRSEAAHFETLVRVAQPRPFNPADLLDSSPIDFRVDEYEYVPRSVDVFGQRLRVWVGQSNGQCEPNWVELVGELIMRPHRSALREFEHEDERYRSQWSREREIRRQITQEMDCRHENMRAYIRELEGRIRRFRRTDREGTVHQLSSHGPTSALLEFAHDGEHAYIGFKNIVVFFDDGDGTGENPPSWVATAQDVDDNTTSKVPEYMNIGYGTSPKAAIIALLAAGLGVYARMINISGRDEKTK